MQNKDKDIEKLQDLFHSYSGLDAALVEKLPGAGSGRRYFRLSADVAADVHGFSCIGVAGEALRDCKAFVNLSRAFLSQGINVPAVYGCSEDHMHYIQQDLGSESLFDLLTVKDCGGVRQEEVESAVRDTLTELVKMQNVDVSAWQDIVEYKPFCFRQAMWDLNYFKYEYLRPSGVDVDEEALEDDFEAYAAALCDYGGIKPGFMYRDFQSRNVMLVESKPYFIDFQGGRLGPGIYDAVSFLWQAKANFSDAFRSRMLDHYFEVRKELTGESRDAVKENTLANRFALFRTLQVLGAYGLRGLVERKAHFIESIPAALLNLRNLIARGAVDGYPELRRVCDEICKDSRFIKDEGAGLTVTVYSFSYKKGYPVDYTGNGGGFMFDCRGMHNPGRYPEYRMLTGRDKPVSDFLEERGEVQKFVDKAVEMVSPSVEAYLRRGFTNLQIGFGCTGGQHRSVYCAEHAARQLSEKFPSATVRLIHREHPSGNY